MKGVDAPIKITVEKGGEAGKMDELAGSTKLSVGLVGSPTIPPPRYHSELPPNPLLDVSRLRTPSRGRGNLFPGSLFKGKQTSGRSSYEVEVRIVDVDFTQSTLSGYLSISHLTDNHPQLTTFFSGEIVGEKYGFLTGPRYYAQATEQDDMRHWSRFEKFRKVRNELRRPALTMSDLEYSSGGDGVGRERGFCFMRWKEKFLVPDHTVRDISGASFAGFYYLQLEFEPPSREEMEKRWQVSVSAEGTRSAQHVIVPVSPVPATPEGDSVMDTMPSPIPFRRRRSSQGARAGQMPSPPPGVPSAGVGSRPATWRRQSIDKNRREDGYPVLKVSVNAFAARYRSNAKHLCGK